LLAGTTGDIMRRLRFSIAVVICVVCLPSFSIQALGWEFELQGVFSWKYSWLDQHGTGGFFGPYDVDNGAGTTTANLNLWTGALFDTNLSPGASAGWSRQQAQFTPTLKINRAIRLRAEYRIGSYGNPLDALYLSEDFPGIGNAISEGQWTMFWVTAETPWGTIEFGKRPWVFGTGLQYDGADGATIESVRLVAPMGPLRLGIGFHPFRFAGRSTNPAYGDPYDLLISRYYTRGSKSGGLSKDFEAFATYSAGAFEAGILGCYGSFHIGPEAALGANQPVAQDSDYFHGTTFLKYFGGSFFFNAEGAWLYWTDKYSDPTSIVGPPNPRYIEQWRYMLEFGIVAGPTKLTFLQAWTPGPDRRGGRLIGKQSAAFTWHPSFDSFLGNYDVFNPYSYLFSNGYGSGTNAFDLSGDGFVRDALVLAVRLDYALAANLNVFGSFFRAERTSKGYGWGCLAPNDAAFNGTANDGNTAFNINGANGSPNIPETSLGFEINAGLNWQLLEGCTAGVVFGYWQPGRWFSYACVDRSVSGWQAPAAGNLWGTRPGRRIDPVTGGQLEFAFFF